MVTRPHRINRKGAIKIKAAGPSIRNAAVMHDDIIQQIEHFRFRRAHVTAEWRNKGYTLFAVETGRPIARLRPIGRDALMELFYWSLRKERWRPLGPFGQTIVPLDEALRIIAGEPIFWVGI